MYIIVISIEFFFFKAISQIHLYCMFWQMNYTQSTSVGRCGECVCNHNCTKVYKKNNYTQ